MAILEAAENSQQHRTALAAIREARSNLEMLARLVGELESKQLAQQDVNIRVVYDDYPAEPKELQQLRKIIAEQERELAQHKPNGPGTLRELPPGL